MLVEEVLGEEGFGAGRAGQALAGVRLQVGQPGHLGTRLDLPSGGRWDEVVSKNSLL